jgi:hypothetical protein
MMGCNYIKRLIDEADKSDLLPFEVNQHIGGCGDCERFASEREGLRKLLASESRVSAPVNFDAMLKARLAATKRRSAFSWLSSPGYLRLGAATAALVIMFFAAQYAGLFSAPDQRSIARAPEVTSPPAAPDSLVRHQPEVMPRQPVAPVTIVAAGQRSIRPPRTGITSGRRTTPDAYFTAEDGGVVLVRGRNGEMDVPMPTVSVGAQPLLYVSAGQRAIRNAGNSF